jgi:hypothetical protein
MPAPSIRLCWPSTASCHVVIRKSESLPWLIQKIVQKKSARWIEGYERVAEMAAKMAGTRLVYVANREADLVEMMRRAPELDTPVDWLVRPKHNRCVPDGDGDKL